METPNTKLLEPGRASQDRVARAQSLRASDDCREPLLCGHLVVRLCKRVTITLSQHNA
jgi:hypothetical protein